MSESTPALATTAIAFDHTFPFLYLCLYSYLPVSDPERVVASVEPVDSGDSVDETVNEERHG